jgi:hypothetical protein
MLGQQIQGRGEAIQVDAGDTLKDQQGDSRVQPEGIEGAS